MFDQFGLTNTFIVFVFYGYFTSLKDLRNIPTQTQLRCSPQTDQPFTCSCYIISIKFSLVYIYIKQIIN